MPWSKTETVQVLKYKSDKIKEVFAEAANSSLQRGLTEDEAIFSGLQAVKSFEIRNQVQHKPKEIKEPPEHLRVILEAVEKRNKEIALKALKTPLEGSIGSNEGVGTTELEKALKTRSIKSADFDKQDRLVIRFDDGSSITTRAIDIKSYIEQYVTIATPSVFDYIQFNTQLTDTIEYLEGRVFYDNTSKSLSYYNDAQDVTVNLGQEQLVRVYNHTGVMITNGQVVYINGANTGFPTVALAQSNQSISSEAVLGVSTHDIHNLGYGYITVIGIVNGLNTSGFNPGDVLYLSPTQSGGFTNVAPVQPNYEVVVGYVVSSGITDGKIFVRVDKKNWFPSVEIISTIPSYALPTIPTIYKPTLVNHNDGFVYDSNTGELTILNTGTYAISITFNAVAGAANKKIYFYSEENLGSGWEINKYSGKVLELINGTQTQLLLTSNRYFVKGSKIRLYIWGDAGVQLQTINLPGTVAGTVLLPAYRFLMA